MKHESGMRHDGRQDGHHHGFHLGSGQGSMDGEAQLWLGMLSHLRSHHGTLCRQWFEELKPIGVLGGALNLRTQTVLHRDYLKRMCSEAFNDAALSVSGRLLPVRFLGPDDPAPAKIEGKRDSGLEVQRPVTGKGFSSNGGSGSSGRETPIVVTTRGASIGSLGGSSGGGQGSERGGNGQATPMLSPGLPPIGSRNAPDGLVVNPDNSFENFVVGPGNRLAQAAARAVADKPGRAYNPYFIHGGVGLGKTHLLHAMCLRIAEANPGVNMYYLSCEGFVTQFMESVQSGHMADFRHRFRDVDVLVIDDIHFLAKRDRTQEEFFHTFNTLYQASKQIILSSDAAPHEIPQLEARLVSRFNWGLVVKLEPPCYETRVAIVKTKARLRGLVMPEEVANYIATRIDTNIRELEGAIIKLQIQSSVEGKAIDLAMARASLGEPTGATGTGEPSIQVIMAVVTDFFGVRLTDLQSKRRQRSVALPRQVCMYLARKHTRMSLEEIGGYFGGRDHTTVMHAVKTVEQRRGPDGEFDGHIKSIEDRLRPATPAAASA